MTGDATGPGEVVVKTATCPACQTELNDHEGPFCWGCEDRYPASLLKAVMDNEWDYALKLRTGEVWRFRGAEISGEYATIHLGGYPTVDQASGDPMPFVFDRGVDVRVADIIWCADAPDGS